MPRLNPIIKALEEEQASLKQKYEQTGAELQRVSALLTRFAGLIKRKTPRKPKGQPDLPLPTNT